MPDDPRLAALSRLLAVVDRLRAPGGCPWDRSLDLARLAPHLLEEAYEAAEALLAGDRPAAAGELGDVLMNVLLACRVAEDAGDFSLADSAGAVADKLVRRHPHVFGDGAAEGVSAVLANWERIKQEERRADPDRSVLAGLPKALPALLLAFRMGEKAARVGFRWSEPEQALAKLREETGELEQAVAAGDRAALEEEVGDVLFSLANVARHVDVEPETALRKAAARFEARFRWVEAETGGALEGRPADELVALWRAAKVALADRASPLPADAPAEWRAALREAARARTALLAATRDVPPDVVTKRPAPDVSDWSIALHLEHLAIVEEAVARGLARALDEAGSAALPFPPEGLALHPPRNVLRPDPEARYEAPDFAQPKGGLDKPRALAALEASRGRLHALAPRLAALDPRAILAPHPFFGELDALQWFEFIAQHERRHLGHVLRIRKSFG